MADMITRTGLARHPDSFNSILEHLKNPEKYEEGEFNTDLVNLIGEWYGQDETKKTKPNLVLIGLGSIGAASTIRYEVIDKKLQVLEKLEEEVPHQPIIKEVIKTKWDSTTGLIFNTEGDYSDGNNVGIWVPEPFTNQLNLHVHLTTTKTD